MTGRVLNEEELLEDERHCIAYPMYDYASTHDVLNYIATIRDRDKTIKELIHAKARLADECLEKEAEIKRLRARINDAIDMCEDFSESEDDAFSMIARDLRDSLGRG